ncbi:MAG: thioredoxin domain-containing protein [Candidatus Hydrogenedentales bacterium]|jgi:thioredoxin 1
MRVTMMTTFVLAVCLISCFTTAARAEGATSALSTRYPQLASGVLSFANLDTLPEGVLLKSGDIEVTRAELDSEMTKAKGEVTGQLEKNRLFLLENVAMRKLLLQAARAAGSANQATEEAEKDLLKKYFDSVTIDVAVTDDEVAKFYEENKDMCGGASLDQIKGQLRDYVLGQKKQEAVAEHIRTIGQRSPIVLASSWVDEQAKLALDNPVDKARASGKPSLVDFGASGCRPCDMMTPILESLKSKYDGKLNVLFVHVREEQILASRYGIQSIPVQVFFNKEGKEIERHTGFYAQDEIEKRLKEMGVE